MAYGYGPISGITNPPSIERFKNDLAQLVFASQDENPEIGMTSDGKLVTRAGVERSLLGSLMNPGGGFGKAETFQDCQKNLKAYLDSHISQKELAKRKVKVVETSLSMNLVTVGDISIQIAQADLIPFKDNVPIYDGARANKPFAGAERIRVGDAPKLKKFMHSVLGAGSEYTQEVKKGYDETLKRLYRHNQDKVVELRDFLLTRKMEDQDNVEDATALLLGMISLMNDGPQDSSPGRAAAASEGAGSGGELNELIKQIEDQVAQLEAAPDTGTLNALLQSIDEMNTIEPGMARNVAENVLLGKQYFPATQQQLGRCLVENRPLSTLLKSEPRRQTGRPVGRDSASQPQRPAPQELPRQSRRPAAQEAARQPQKTGSQGSVRAASAQSQASSQALGGAQQPLAPVRPTRIAGCMKISDVLAHIQPGEKCVVAFDLDETLIYEDAMGQRQLVDKDYANVIQAIKTKAGEGNAKILMLTKNSESRFKRKVGDEVGKANINLKLFGEVIYTGQKVYRKGYQTDADFQRAWDDLTPKEKISPDDKGQAIIEYLRRTGFPAKHLLLVDDGDGNLDKFESACAGLETRPRCTTFHFSGAVDYISGVSYEYMAQELPRLRRELPKERYMEIKREAHSKGWSEDEVKAVMTRESHAMQRFYASQGIAWRDFKLPEGYLPPRNR